MLPTSPTAIRLTLAMVLSLILTIPAVAAEQLPMVVVTATRTANTVDQILAPITVIEREDLLQSNAATIPEVLGNVPGVDFYSSGGWGKVANLSVRGTNSNHTLLLVDGIPLGSATSGTPAWEYLPLAHVSRIEVVRGPRSSLYGSSAIGGIVQMFTPRGTGPAHVEVSAMAGSLNTADVRASVAGSVGASHYYLGGGHLYTAGIDAGSPWSPHESDSDGYHNSSLAMRVGHDFGNAEIDVHVLHAAGRSESDGAPNEDFLQEVAGIDLILSPLMSWQSRLTVAEARDERDSVPNSRFHTRRAHTTWQNDLSLARDYLLTVGIDHQDERVDASTAFTVNSRANTGVFLQHQATFGRHDLIAGVRYDDNEAFGGHTTGNLAYGMHLTPSLRLTAAWGSAFKAPTFNDLYWPLSFGFQGNPRLTPETANSHELGLMGKSHWGSWELRAFRTDINDLITITDDYASMVNLKRARIDGIEAQATTQIARWDLSAALSFLDPRDRDTDQILPRRARRTAQLSAARIVGPLRSALTILNQGERTDTGNTQLAGYTLVGLHFDYAWQRSWTITGGVENLLAEDYQTVTGYNSPGRTVMMGVRYTN